MSKTYIDNKGYRRFKDSGKLVHRWAAQKKVGGKIYHGRVVHHKDGNKLNNRRDNLQIMSRGDHSSLHARDRMEENAGCAVGIIGMILRMFID